MSLAIDIAIGVFAFSMLLCLVRLLRGPSTADRVLAIDTLYVNALAQLILFGMKQGSALYFEAALLIGMFGFVSTVVMAKFIIRRDIME